MMVQDIIDKAKKDPRKGSYSVYEEYKELLSRLNPTTVQYESTCRLLAIALRV